MNYPIGESPTYCRVVRVPLNLALTVHLPRVRESPGHKDGRSMLHTHVLKRGKRGVRGPADALTRGLAERLAETA